MLTLLSCLPHPCKPAHMLLCVAFLCCASVAQVCVRCLLFGRGPQSQGHGGYQGGHVVLLDLDAKFDMIRMIKVGEHCNHGQVTRRVKGTRRSRGNRVTVAVAAAGRMAIKKFACCLTALHSIGDRWLWLGWHTQADLPQLSVLSVA